MPPWRARGLVDDSIIPPLIFVCFVVTSSALMRLKAHLFNRFRGAVSTAGTRHIRPSSAISGRRSRSPCILEQRDAIAPDTGVHPYLMFGDCIIISL